ncbi:hypothetical protein J4G37_59525, partial [Microvirga sp. 3-52]|nr:hypothetical protein [Microvirga sp. 3-52]
GGKNDEKAIFAEGMFNDLSFPKEETKYDPLSRYIEEKAEEEMRPVVFDELYSIYFDRVKPSV